MSNISIGQAPRDGWRHLLVMLAVLPLVFWGSPIRQRRRFRPFTISGPAYQPFATCGRDSPSLPCSGNITASFTFNGVAPAGYSGELSLKRDGVAWTTMAGVGSLSQRRLCTGITAVVTNGSH